MDRPLVVENDRERKRLQLLVGRISDGELRVQMWEGWTIAAAFAHLAFGDQRALVLMLKWEKLALRHRRSMMTLRTMPFFHFA